MTVLNCAINNKSIICSSGNSCFLTLVECDIARIPKLFGISIYHDVGSQSRINRCSDTDINCD